MWLSVLLLHVALCAGARRRGGDAEAAADSAGLPRARHAGARRHAEDARVYYTTEKLDELRSFMQGFYRSERKNHSAEALRLEAVADRANTSAADEGALEEAMNISKQQQADADAAALGALELYHTARAMLGARGGAPSCRLLACGPHGECTLRSGRARCECRPCFEGDGFICSPVPCGPPAALSASPLLGQPPPGYPTVPHVTPKKVEELQLAIISHSHLVVAVRAAADGDVGFLVVGRVQGDTAVWGPWQAFSATLKAFGPALVGFPNGRLVLAFRDEQRSGTGYLVGGQLMNATGDLRASLEEPQAFVRRQGERMALVPLATSRAACLYAGGGGGATPFGGIALVQSLAGGGLGMLGKFRFADGMQVSHIAATALAPASFAVGFRVLPDPAMQVGQPSRELSVTWVGMQDNELVVDPRPLALEPNRSGMQARSLALVSQNLFAYSYESGLQRQVKVAIVRVDPATHRMTLAGGPEVVARGRVAYVQSLSLPAGPTSPKTFTYLQHPGGNGIGKVCGISAAGGISSCKEVAWADTELKAVSGSRLPDGRLAFAFANAAGEPFFQLLSAEEGGAQAV